VIKLAQEIAKLEGQLKTLADFKLLDSIWESLQELQNDLNILRMDMMELGDNAESLDALKEKTTGILEKANEILNEALGNIGMLKTRVQIQNQVKHKLLKIK
jgi:chromosome segregation ATPase